MGAALATPWRPYGASELKRAARPHLVRALLLGDLLGILGFALAWALSLWLGHAVVTRELGERVIVDVLPAPPPMLEVRQPPPAVAPATPAHAAAAVPVPVPEALAPLEATMASQEQLAASTPSAASGGEVVVQQPPAGEDALNRPGTVPFVDQLPEPVRRVSPQYPDLARQAQVEGLVRVNLLVGGDGRVRDVQLDPKVHVTLLDRAALDAARQWEFQPALVHGRPVAVWVALPFRFTLH